jgi:hypothetical protein
VAACSPTNQTRGGVCFAHQRQGAPRAGMHSMAVGTSDSVAEAQVVVVGVQQRCFC